ncbi:hypothetical protein [Luteococcus japonicus]|nr:hypothetical protein [Luteococcus japonicus]
MTNPTQEIALANGRTIEVTGEVELLASGALHVRPEHGSTYFPVPQRLVVLGPGRGSDHAACNLCLRRSTLRPLPAP